MARMHIAPAERALVKLQCLRLMVTQQLDPARSHLIMTFVEAYLTLNEDERQIIGTDIERLPRLEKERIMEFTNQWIEEGRQKGRQEVMGFTNQWIEEGRQKGRQEGQQEASVQLIKQLIVKRFGAITRAQTTRMKALSLPRLQALTEVLLDLEDANALDAWLATQSPLKRGRK
jgi:flagellar biosynthesis/type III secretory pathway protein FliH